MRTTRTVGLMVFGLLSLFGAGCATVTQGPLQRIHVDSDPQGAAIQLHDCGVAGRVAAQTPTELLVSRMATRCTVELSQPEYGTRSVALTRQVAGAVFGNLAAFEVLELCDEQALDCDSVSEYAFFTLLGAAVSGAGAVIDRLSGSMYEQIPDRFCVDFLYPDTPAEGGLDAEAEAPPVKH